MMDNIPNLRLEVLINYVLTQIKVCTVHIRAHIISNMDLVISQV